MNYENLSYEEEQLQIILLNELRNKILQEDRKIKLEQDIEYQESLCRDEELNTEPKELSLEEMRQLRIKRFS